MKLVTREGNPFSCKPEAGGRPPRLSSISPSLLLPLFNNLRTGAMKTVLGKNHKIKDFKLLDFSAMRSHLDTAKQIKRAATDGEKAAAKTAKEELMVRTIEKRTEEPTRLPGLRCGSPGCHLMSVALRWWQGLMWMRYKLCPRWLTLALVGACRRVNWMDTAIVLLPLGGVRCLLTFFFVCSQGSIMSCLCRVWKWCRGMKDRSNGQPARAWVFFPPPSRQDKLPGTIAGMYYTAVVPVPPFDSACRLLFSTLAFASRAAAQVQLRDRGQPPGEGGQLQRRAPRPVPRPGQAPQDRQAQGQGHGVRHLHQLRRGGVRAAVQRPRIRLAVRAARPFGERRRRRRGGGGAEKGRAVGEGQEGNGGGAEEGGLLFFLFFFSC